MPRILPFLLFQNNQAEPAMNFYTSVVPGSSITDIVRYPEGTPAAGTVMRAVFSVAGQSVMCTDSAVPHSFTFTPAFSFFLECESEEELTLLAGALSDGGQVFMPLANYGFSRKFTWVSDRFGVSWQLNLD